MCMWKWGAGGALSYVDTVISMCISGHTHVCCSAWNGKMNVQEGGKKRKMMLFYLSGSHFFF